VIGGDLVPSCASHGGEEQPVGLAVKSWLCRTRALSGRRDCWRARPTFGILRVRV